MYFFRETLFSHILVTTFLEIFHGNFENLRKTPTYVLASRTFLRILTISSPQLIVEVLLIFGTHDLARKVLGIVNGQQKVSGKIRSFCP